MSSEWGESMSDIPLGSQAGEDEGLDSKSRSYCEARWNEALARCKGILSVVDYDKIVPFESLEALLSELSQMEQRYRRATLPQVMHHIESSLKHFNSFTTAVALSTRSYFIKTALLWGFINLLLKLAMDSEAIMKYIIDMLQELGHNLEVFEIYQSMFTSDSHMAEDLVDVFVEVLIFAASAISYLRSHPLENVALNSWPSMTKKFESASSSIIRKTRHIKDKAEALSLKSLVKQRSQPPLDDIASISLVDISSEKPSLYKPVEVPRFPFHHLPFRGVPNFSGRTTLMEQIDSAFRNPTGEDNVRQLALWGLAGVGKSQTAFRYAQNCRDRGVQIVVWIQSETELQLSETFSQVAVGLKLSPPEDILAHGQNRYIVLKWLAETDAEWLLIFDNVEDADIVLGYLPSATHGSILITCRSVTIADALSAQMLEVQSFSEDEGSEFLLSVFNKNPPHEEDRDAARQLTSLLGGLPFAMNIMAHQMCVRRKNIQEFLSFYQDHYQQLHKSSKPKSSLYYKETLATVWRVAFTNLASDAAGLLGMLSLLSPDSIPEALFQPPPSIRSYATSTLPSFLHDSWEFSEAIRELIDAALISKNPETSMLYVHRLIQTEWQARLSLQDFQSCFSLLTDLLYGAFPQGDEGAPLRKYWPQCKDLIPHVIAVSATYSAVHAANSSILEFPNFTKLIANAAWYLHETNSYSICIDLIMNGFKNCQDLGSLPYATLCNIAGCIFSERAQMTQAEDFYNRSLRIREKLLPPDHPALADLYNNIGCLYLAIDDTAQATSYLDKAHKITMSRPPHEREQTIHLRHLNLASLYEVTKEYSLAKLEIEQGRKAAVLYFGEHSHFDAAADSHLGNILSLEGDYATALDVYGRAMRIFKAEMVTQPAVSTVAYKMGRTCLKWGQVDRAIEHLKESLAICRLNERLKGDEGESARVMRKLAEAHKQNGNVEEGEKLRKEAEKIRKEIQGAAYDRMPDEDSSWDAMVDIIFR